MSLPFNKLNFFNCDSRLFYVLLLSHISKYCWDPFILDVIYKNYTENVPMHPKEYGATAKLDRMLKFLRDTPETSEMYKKYIPEKFQKGVARSTLKTVCMQWAKETTLFEILSKMKYSDDKFEDEIEETIELLQNTVSYRIPLLLKPIFDIKNSNSVFLGVYAIRCI